LHAQQVRGYDGVNRNGTTFHLTNTITNAKIINRNNGRAAHP
jgi:hypothetical protein